MSGSEAEPALLGVPHRPGRPDEAINPGPVEIRPAQARPAQARPVEARLTQAVGT